MYYTIEQFQAMKRKAAKKPLSSFAQFHRDLSHVILYYNAVIIDKWEAFLYCKDPYKILAEHTKYRCVIKTS